MVTPLQEGVLSSSKGFQCETLPVFRWECLKKDIVWQMVTPLTCPVWVPAAVERLLGAPSPACAPPPLLQLSEQLC